jgi:hypothetical protein
VVVVLSCRKLTFMASCDSSSRSLTGPVSLLYIPMTGKLVLKLMVASADPLLALYIDLRLEKPKVDVYPDVYLVDVEFMYLPLYLPKGGAEGTTPRTYLRYISTTLPKHTFAKYLTFLHHRW